VARPRNSGKKFTERIDGIAATIMALGRTPLDPETEDGALIWMDHNRVRIPASEIGVMAMVLAAWPSPPRVRPWAPSRLYSRFSFDRM
jgi:hypothetical protein